MLKEKLGIGLHEENCYKEETIKIQDDIEETDKESTKKLIKELSKELDEESDEESYEEVYKELLEIISPKKDENTTDWYDKNKFNEILTTIDSNKFNHKNKIGKLKFNGINNLINNIKNNTISEALAKQKLDALNEIKKAEIKNKRLISSQKKLLNLFDDLLEAIFNNKSISNIDDNVSVNESVNKSVNESMNESVNESNTVSKNENESVDKIHDNVDTNNYFIIIDKTKSFEDQIEILKKMDDLSQYWDLNYCDENKRLNFKIFKLKFAYIWNDVDEELFEKIFGHTYVALADKLLNTTSKEENQIFINDIKKNRDKIYEQDDFSNFIIQPSYKRNDLIDARNVILNFNEIIELDLT